MRCVFSLEGREGQKSHLKFFLILFSLTSVNKLHQQAESQPWHNADVTSFHHGKSQGTEWLCRCSSVSTSRLTPQMHTCRDRKMAHIQKIEECLAFFCTPLWMEFLLLLPEAQAVVQCYKKASVLQLSCHKYLKLTLKWSFHWRLWYALCEELT